MKFNIALTFNKCYIIQNIQILSRPQNKKTANLKIISPILVDIHGMLNDTAV